MRTCALHCWRMDSVATSRCANAVPLDTPSPAPRANAESKRRKRLFIQARLQFGLTRLALVLGRQLLKRLGGFSIRGPAGQPHAGFRLGPKIACVAHAETA